MKAAYAHVYDLINEKRSRSMASNKRLNKIQIYWSSNVNAPLGAQYKSQIAFLLATIQTGTTEKRFYKEIVKQHPKLGAGRIPQRRAGLPSAVSGGGKALAYNEDTYYRWLSCHSSSSPADEDLVACVEAILRAADELLKDHLKPGASIRALLEDFRGTHRDAMSRAISLLRDVGEARDWRAIDSRVFGSMPTGPQRGLASATTEARYAEVLSAVREHRSVEVTGPHYSGKNTLLRKLVTENVRGFQIASGSILTICALSLYEMTGSEAISGIADFYRSALGVKPSAQTLSGLLSEIAHFSRQFPTLIVIAGLEAVDSDEIVRAIHQDLVGEMVSRILDGHSETRLLVSSTKRSYDILRRRALSRDEGRKIQFDRVINLAEQTIATTNYEYYTIKQCVLTLCSEDRGYDRQAFLAHAADYWLDEDVLRLRAIPPEVAWSLGKLVSGRLLSRAERFCLGLVALCHDGLMPTTIKSIVAAIQGSLDPELIGCEPTEVLDKLPDEVVRKPARARDDGPSCYQIERVIGPHRVVRCEC